MDFTWFEQSCSSNYCTTTIVSYTDKSSTGINHSLSMNIMSVNMDLNPFPQHNFKHIVIKKKTIKGI